MAVEASRLYVSREGGGSGLISTRSTWPAGPITTSQAGGGAGSYHFHRGRSLPNRVASSRRKAAGMKVSRRPSMTVRSPTPHMV